MGMRLWWGVSAAVVLSFGLPACGGGYDAWSRSSASGGAAPAAVQTAPAPEPAYARGESVVREQPSDAMYRGAGDGARVRYAEADTGGAAAGGSGGDAGEDDPEPEEASDAHDGPLLIYLANVGLAVHQVDDKMSRVEALVRDAGGHLDQRTDQMIRVRVPAGRFQEVLHAILELGDVLSRNVQVQDVTEEFHDVQLRIRTLEAMYARVQRLLEESEDVRSALAVEEHLERITMQLETLRGRLRYLSDRVAFSTITVTFQEQSTVSEPTFELPFAWLRGLGLQNLLRLR